MSFPYHFLLCKSFQTMFTQLVSDSESLKLNKMSGYTGVVIRSFPDDYFSADSLSNHMTEEHRMKALFNPQKFKKSPYVYWQTLAKHIKDSMSSHDLREMIYHNSGEANVFNPMIAIVAFKTFGIKTVLDPCAGWGDRRIASSVAGVTMYTGFDTNTNLISAYEKINEILAELTPSTKCVMRFEPFEQADISSLGQFDCVFTSPPYYDLELYEGSNTSTTLYKNKPEWFDKFYNVLLAKAVSAVKPQGYIMLYISDYMFVSTNDRLCKVHKCTQQLPIGFYQSTPSQPTIIPSKIRKLYIWQT